MDNTKAQSSVINSAKREHFVGLSRMLACQLTFYGQCQQRTIAVRLYLWDSDMSEHTALYLAPCSLPDVAEDKEPAVLFALFLISVSLYQRGFWGPEVTALMTGV